MTKRKMLVAITGKARSGKDTLGNLMVLTGGFHRMAFADPLKAAMAAVFGVAEEEFHCDNLKDKVHPDWQMTRRAMLQHGADALREKFGQDLWIKRWVFAYSHIDDAKDVVITDLRSDAEAQAIRNLGGIVVHLHRDGAGLQGVEAQHHTEKGVSTHLIDVSFSNNGTKPEIGGKVLSYLQEMKCR